MRTTERLPRLNSRSVGSSRARDLLPTREPHNRERRSDTRPRTPRSTATTSITVPAGAKLRIEERELELGAWTHSRVSAAAQMGTPSEPAHTPCRILSSDGRYASPYGATPPGELWTLLAAFREQLLLRTSLRKNSAMMMAIARKPSRIAYSVVVWPSSRSRSSLHCNLQCNERAQQDVGHKR